MVGPLLGTLLGLALLVPIEAQAAEASPFDGNRITILTGYDATELPDEDGPEMMYALEAGHDRTVGRWVFGGAVSVGGTDADKTEYGIVVPGDRLRVRYGNDVYAGARVGHTIGHRLLAFGRAGLALTEMRSEYTEDAASGSAPHVPGANLIPKFSRPGTLLGFWTGGGIEYSLGRHLLALSEYRYSNFHDGIYRHQVIVGLGIRF